MRRHPTQLAPEPSGNNKETSWFKTLLRNIRERSIVGGRGVRVSYNTNETVVELDDIPQAAASGGFGAITRFQIFEIFDNYLRCRAYDDPGDSVTSTEDVKVAIPYFLRASTYAALTLGGFTYTTVNGQIRCNQTGSSAAYVVKSFFPTYAIGQDIYAIQPAGKTDVTVAGARLEWIDANVEGRRLDTSLTDLQICRLENNVVVQRNVVVEGGPIY